MRPPGKVCVWCFALVYVVQNHRGERFLVDHLGRRWCPATRR